MPYPQEAAGELSKKWLKKSESLEKRDSDFLLLSDQCIKLKTTSAPAFCRQLAIIVLAEVIGDNGVELFAAFVVKQYEVDLFKAAGEGLEKQVAVGEEVGMDQGTVVDAEFRGDIGAAFEEGDKDIFGLGKVLLDGQDAGAGKIVENGSAVCLVLGKAQRNILEMARGEDIVFG